jgi:transglutaminase-like putative cysteine protease
VEILPYTPPMADETMPWDRVEPYCRENSIFSEDCLGALEFLYPTSLIKKLPVFREYTMPSFPEDRPVLEAVMDLTCRIHKDFKFDPKATTVATPLEEVMKNRRGVCQDFAHLQIACLRTMNIPARYVSGYLETDPPPGKPRLVGADASHAWVSFFSPDHGWIDVDPTNNLLPSSRHITVAWGRDYNDVSPVRGVILGSGDHSLKVSVDVAPEMEKNI